MSTLFSLTLSHSVVGSALLPETGTRHVGHALVSSIQTPGSPRSSPSSSPFLLLPGLRGLLLNCYSSLFDDPPTSVLSLLKIILDPATRGIHPKYKADRVPCPHSLDRDRGENSCKPFIAGSSPVSGDVDLCPASFPL